MNTSQICLKCLIPIPGSYNIFHLKVVPIVPSC